MSSNSEAYRGARNEYNENCERRKKVMPHVKNELLIQLITRKGIVKITSLRELMQSVKRNVQAVLNTKVLSVYDEDVEVISVYDEDVQEAFYRLAEDGLITFGKTIEITQAGRDLVASWKK